MKITKNAKERGKSGKKANRGRRKIKPIPLPQICHQEFLLDSMTRTMKKTMMMNWIPRKGYKNSSVKIICKEIDM